MTGGYAGAPCFHPADRRSEVDGINGTGLHVGQVCDDCGETVRSEPATAAQQWDALGVDWYGDVRGGQWGQRAPYADAGLYQGDPW